MEVFEHDDFLAKNYPKNRKHQCPEILDTREERKFLWINAVLWYHNTAGVYSISENTLLKIVRMFLLYRTMKFLPGPLVQVLHQDVLSRNHSEQLLLYQHPHRQLLPESVKHQTL